MSDDMLRRFAREMMGSSVAHMSDEQFDAWMEPWRKAAEKLAPMSENPEFPAWFVKLRTEARGRLLAALRMRETEHKSEKPS